jgi:hypothetical protein
MLSLDFALKECVCEFNKADFYEVILRIFRLSFNRSFPVLTQLKSEQFFVPSLFHSRSLYLSLK